MEKQASIYSDGTLKYESIQESLIYFSWISVGF